jgi:RNA polymerase sigma-70 factor (ECF subfamily)
LGLSARHAVAPAKGISPHHAGTPHAAVAADEFSAERALVEAAQRGDKPAFAALVDLHQRAIYGFLRARLLEPSDAEDLCQEVFLRCYLGREKFERAPAVRPWLFGIARNLLREHVRTVVRRREVAWTELCLELDSLVETPDAQDEDALAHLPACLDSLGKSAREAIDLKYTCRLRLAQIGEKLHRSEGAVKLLVHRARQALKHCLDGKLQRGNS